MFRQKKTRPGKIIPHGVLLEKHEYATIVFLTQPGFDVELIPKSNRAGAHTPDIFITGLAWEIKSPKGEGSSLMKNTLQKAARQSPNIIIDLQRTKRHESKCLSELNKEFMHSKRLQRMKIITKEKKVLDFEK